MPKKEVEVKANTEIATQTAMDQLFQQNAGAGLEDADKDSFAIPFLKVLQSMSPQVDPDDGEYIEDAKPGMLFNTVTNELSDNVIVIPCHMKRTFIEWVPRDAGGGFNGEHTPDSDVVQNTPAVDGRKTLPDGNELSDTRTHYVLVIREDGSFSPAIISMSSTQIKKSKLWMAKINEIKMRDENGKLYNPPSFSHYYKLTTMTESNDQGKWKGWVVSAPLKINDDEQGMEHLMAAMEFHNLVRSGEAKADYSKMDGEQTVENSDF